MPVRYRISNITAGIILVATGVTDALQFALTITVVGSVVSMIVGTLLGVILWITFTLHGVKYSGSAGLKKIASTFGAMVLEMVPFIDALPLVSVGAIIVISETRKEDRQHAKTEAERQANEQKQQQISAQNMFRAQRVAHDNAVMRAANDNAEQEVTLSQAA